MIPANLAAWVVKSNPNRVEAEALIETDCARRRLEHARASESEDENSSLALQLV